MIDKTPCDYLNAPADWDEMPWCGLSFSYPKYCLTCGCYQKICNKPDQFQTFAWSRVKQLEDNINV